LQQLQKSTFHTGSWHLCTWWYMETVDNCRRT
jgi:hypothetical protein